jgi:hypothetical protein
MACHSGTPYRGVAGRVNHSSHIHRANKHPRGLLVRELNLPSPRPTERNLWVKRLAGDESDDASAPLPTSARAPNGFPAGARPAVVRDDARRFRVFLLRPLQYNLDFCEGYSGILKTKQDEIVRLRRMQMDNSLFAAALVGYESQLQKINDAIAEIRSQLGQRPGRSSAQVVAAPKARRTMSAAARKRIAAAQKKRWAAFHAKAEKPAKKVAVAKKAAPKRKMSPERKAALVANLAKARAARAAKKSAGDKVLS